MEKMKKDGRYIFDFDGGWLLNGNQSIYFANFLINGREQEILLSFNITFQGWWNDYNDRCYHFECSLDSSFDEVGEEITLPDESINKLEAEIERQIYYEFFNRHLPE